MPSRPEDVIVVKLPRALVARLREWGHRTVAHYRRTGRGAECPDADNLSIREIVSILLRRDEAHRERSRKPKRVRYQG